MRILLPSWLNVGLAPPAPRGALALAPWLTQVPPNTLHSLFTRMPRSAPGLLAPVYRVSLSIAVPDAATRAAPIAHTPLLPPAGG